jgi:hypothetical protein
MRGFAGSLVAPVAAAVVNYWVWTFLVPAAWSEVAFNVCRGLIAGWAGWRVVSRGAGGLRLAALAGAITLFVDHVVIKGGYFLVSAIFVAGPARQRFLLACAGVCLSYLMFVAIPMAISFCGGVAARARKGVQGAPA